MKTYITLALTLLISVAIFAQGRGINYKALIKDSAGNVFSEETINVRLSILNSSDTSVYSELHTAITDINGIVILNIGNGDTVISGDFFSIIWESDLYQLQTEIDPEQDGTFENLGTTQFQAVPYAYSSMDNLWQRNDDDAFSIVEKVGIGTSTPEELLSLEDFNNASIKLQVAATNDTTGIRFENGPKTGFYSHFKIENVNDALRVFVDSDLNAATDYDEIINISYDGTVNVNGPLNTGATLSAQNGTSINEFSTDGTLLGNSNSAVPTEAAVKTYVDSQTSGTKTMMIPAVTFNSDHSSFSIQGRYVRNTSGFSALYAPIVLPAGSVITDIEAAFLDTVNDRNLTLTITRNNNVSNPNIVIGSISSTGTSSLPQVVNLPVTINVNEITQYYMRVSSSSGWPNVSDYGILMVKITYTE